MNRRNRSRMKMVLSSPFMLVGVLIVFLFLARAAWGMMSKAGLSADRFDQAQAGMAKLEDSQSDLSAKVALLSTPAGVEADLREKYHAVAPGESVAVIVGQPSDSAAAADSASVSPPSQASMTSTAHASWWRRFVDFIGL